jgi:hypothetical protein
LHIALVRASGEGVTGEREMSGIAKKRLNSLARLAMGFACAAAINPLLAAELATGVSATRETAAETPLQFARLSTRKNHASDRSSSETTATDQASENDAVSGGAIASALAKCGKGSVGAEGLTLPGAKGEVKLDRCYHGRDQLICSLNALSIEAKTLIGDFTKIVDASYPNVSNVEAVCRITPDDLSAHLQKASTFAARFRELKIEYDRRINCAAKVEQSLREVNLADMPRSEDLLKSMNETLQGDMKDVAAARQRISELAEKMDSSQRAMVVVQKIHQTMCLSTSGEKPANAVQDAPASAQPTTAQPVSATNK